jgi:hypothetical protein
MERVCNRRTRFRLKVSEDDDVCKTKIRKNTENRENMYLVLSSLLLTYVIVISYQGLGFNRYEIC